MASNDDLLSPEEIEALMAAARGSSPSPAPSAPPPKATPKPAAPTPPPASAQAISPDQLLQQAEDNLSAALASSSRSSMPDLSAATAFSFEDLGASRQERPKIEFPIAALQDVELDLRIELGRTELLIEEVLQLREGTVVPLDKLAGDPVDILVNGRLIARGEVLVLNDNFCVRVAEILGNNG